MAAAASNAFAKSVGARASAAATSQMSKLSDKAQGKKIDWTDFNWPSRCEPCNLLHLPEWETLKSYSQGVYLTVRILYTAYLVTVGATFFNLLNCIILSGALGEHYDAANIVYSVLNIIIAGVLGTAVWFKALSGLAEHSGRALLLSKACAFVMIIAALVQAFGDFGNVNGLANLGSDRLQAARDSGKGAAGYWIAASVLEPLVWLAAVGLYGFGSYKLFTQ